MGSLTRVQELFEKALEVDPTEVDAFLEQACGNDLELKAEIKALLESEPQTDGFLETGAMELQARNLAREREGLVGTRLGEYDLLELIGEGGMGTVFRAVDRRNGEPRAIKLLPLEFAEDPARVRRFVREAKTVAALSHPGIAKVYEVCEVAGEHFIVMELVDGVPVSELLAKGPLPLDRIFEIAIGVTESLVVAHSKGVIHRDVKPANVMACKTGGVKLLDFGLLKISREKDSARMFDMSSESLTLPGTVVGTIDYMSPEQILNRDVDHRCDIFTLGILLYQMATGHLPFAGSSVPDTLDRICHRHPYPIARFSVEASEKLEAVVRRCLQKAPDDRYPSARSLLADLNRARAGEAVSPLEPVASHPGRSMRWVWIGSALAILIIVILLVAIGWGSG